MRPGRGQRRGQDGPAGALHLRDLPGLVPAHGVRQHRRGGLHGRGPDQPGPVGHGRQRQLPADPAPVLPPGRRGAGVLLGGQPPLPGQRPAQVDRRDPGEPAQGARAAGGHADRPAGGPGKLHLGGRGQAGGPGDQR